MNIRTPEDWWLIAIAKRKDFEETCTLVYSDAAQCNAELKAMRVAYDVRNADMLHDTLERIWANAPDKPIIHHWPSWGALCNLCSEFWVFQNDSAEGTEHL